MTGSWLDEAADAAVRCPQSPRSTLAIRRLALARLLRAVMSAIPEAERWADEAGAQAPSGDVRRTLLLVAVEARAMRCAADLSVDEVRSLVAEATVLLAELEDGS